MKFLVTCSLLLATAITTQAKVWRINNIAGVNADFAQISTAVGNASVVAGDTLHVEASPTSYNSFTLSKQLVIIGSGYLLDSSLASPNKGNAGLQAQTYGSKVSDITFPTAANGSVLMGLDLATANGYVYLNGVSGASSNNLLFTKCRLGRVIIQYANPLSNITFRKCLIAGNGNGFDLNAANSPASNITVENCIFYNSPINTTAFTTGCVFRNNTIEHTSGYAVNVVNAYFANNIVSNPNNANITLTSSTVKNNIFNGSPVLPSGAIANQVNVSLSTVCTMTGSNDARYQLAAGSPAIAAGVTINSYTPDMGAFGGPDPYKISGIPAIPTVYQYSVPPTIPLNTPSMTISLSTRDNN